MAGALSQRLRRLTEALRSLPILGLGAPVVVLAILAMMVLPIPPFLLDLMFTFNIALSVVVLLVTIYVLRPLDFAIFPTIILVATLLRLSLNVASTRVILLHGHEGGDAAGQVIAAFGEFVIGGNFAVGIIVFIILVIINFVVVTKGAGRVSEVSARFTLDAMPGKQMAIDADLNAGLITPEEAKTRRAEVGAEADFYGSMDGASKFVRGDSIAGILILFINIIGGLIVGMAQYGLSAGEAGEIYVLLTIGDGLVAQIPGLILSTATAIIVTRMTQSQDISQQVATTLFDDPQVLGVTAGVIGTLGLIPGMPAVPFLFFALLAGGGAYWAWLKRQRQAVVAATQPPPPATPPELKELTWDDVPPVDAIGLEIGYALIPLVDRQQGGQLMGRIKGVRRKLSQELGFLIPSVHIRDNLDLPPSVYRLTLMGVSTAEAEVFADRLLAINPGTVYGQPRGVPTRDPAFGLEAFWIEEGERDHAQALGYTVVDASTVVATHLSQVLTTHAARLFGFEEGQQVLDALKKLAPKLADELVPKTMSLALWVKVLQNLLAEKVPVRDVRSIAETLADAARQSQDPDALTAQVRVALSRMIVQNLVGATAEVPVIALDPQLEHLLQQATRGTPGGAPGLEPGLTERMLRSLLEASQKMELAGQSPVLLTAPNLRPVLARMLKASVPNLAVLSYHEIPDERQLKVVASIGPQG